MSSDSSEGVSSSSGVDANLDSASVKVNSGALDENAAAGTNGNDGMSISVSSTEPGNVGSPSERQTAPANLQKFFIELASAQAFLLLMCMVCTSLWLWGDLGISSSKNMSDSIRDYDELALIRVPFLAWSYPLTCLAAIATGPRIALEGKWAISTFGSLLAYIGLLAAFCFGGQILPFIGIAAAKAFGLLFTSGAIFAPAGINIVVSLLLYLGRRMRLV